MAQDRLIVALEGLQEEWRRLGAPVRDHLAPGRPVEETSALLAGKGLSAPAEVVALWAWADGTEPRGSYWSFGPGNGAFLSVEESLVRYDMNREIHQQGDDPDLPDMYWHATWLPIFVLDLDSFRIYIDVSRVGPDGACPVRVVTWEWEQFDVDQTGSIAELIELWTEALRSDLYQLVTPPSGDVFFEPRDLSHRGPVPPLLS